MTHRNLLFIFALSFLTLFSNIQDSFAQDTADVLIELGLDSNFSNDIEYGLDQLLVLSPDDTNAIQETFDTMNEKLNEVLQNEDFSTLSNEELFERLNHYHQNIKINRNLKKFRIDYEQKKEAFKKHALYIALLGKALKHYLINAHELNLGHVESYSQALELINDKVSYYQLLKNEEYRRSMRKVAQYIGVLAMLLTQFEVDFSMLPSMIEKM